MRILKLSTAIAGLVWHQAAASAALPPPTGPCHVGLQRHVVPVLNEADPFWPNNISTSFLVTVYYPTTQDPQPHDWQRPYLDPATAALYEARYNLNAGSLSVLPSPGLIPNAKPLDFHHSKPLPTLFFTPGGGGPPTEVYTLLLSDLASHGYCVLALDHPHEQPFVRYPNGTGIYGLPILYAWDGPTVLAVQSTRVNDSLALLEYLPAFEGETGLRLNKTHVGIFGQSLGGSTAAATLLATERERPNRTAASSFRAGMNIDGTFFGPLAAVHQPFLMLGAEAHGTSPDPNDSDATWPTFAAAQKTSSSYWRWVNLRGTLHHDFSDIGYWKQAVPAIRDGDEQLGSIGGERLVEVWRAYVRGFFDVALVGRGTAGERALLEAGADAEWPEKLWVGGGGPSM